MKKFAVTLLFQMILCLQANSQNTEQANFDRSVMDFVKGPNTCNLFLGIDDSGFDGMTMDYSEKLAAILNSTQMTPRQAYAAIYHQCQRQGALVRQANNSNSINSSSTDQ